MKTPREYIRLITIDKSNLQHIINTGVVNGSLLIGIETIMKEYAKEVARESLKNAAENATLLIERFDKEKVFSTGCIAYIADEGDHFEVDKESILSDKNIPEI